MWDLSWVKDLGFGIKSVELRVWGFWVSGDMQSQGSEYSITGYPGVG